MCVCVCVCVLQLMSKPRLKQIPSEEMDSEEAESEASETYQSRPRAESLREAESTVDSQGDHLNLQHALILNQVHQ